MDSISVPRTDPSQVNFLVETEGILKTVLDTKNFDAGFEFINDLHERGKSFARAIGMVLEGMQKAWFPEEHEGESFYQAAVRHTGLSPVTIQRHVKIQKVLSGDAIPEDYREEIESLGEKSLIQIANLVEAQYDLKDSHWRDLAEAINDKEVGRIARKVKKVEPRSNYLAITIDEQGRLVAHTKYSHLEFGRLDVENEDPIVQKAIGRLTGCSGVLLSVDY